MAKSLRFLALLVAFVGRGVAAPTEPAKYDYIVVGSGPGGGTVAYNLAKAGFSTLLLEAGNDQSTDMSTVLANAGGLTRNDALSWGFWVKHHTDNATDQRFNHMTFTLPDGRFWVGNAKEAPKDATVKGVYYPRGATLGGSAITNAMATWLPNDVDWDYVANLTGDKSWRYGQCVGMAAVAKGCANISQPSEHAKHL